MPKYRFLDDVTEWHGLALALALSGLPVAGMAAEPSGSAALTLPTPAAPVKSKKLRAGGAASGPEVLLVDVVINGQQRPGIAQAEQWPDGVLVLTKDAWNDARLVPLAQGHLLSDGSQGFALNALPGATYRLNRQSQRLEIDAPASAFVGSTLGPQGVLAESAQRAQPGVLLNYDVSLQRGAGSVPITGSAVLEAMAFGKFGNFVSSALVRDEGNGRTINRLDTFWRYDMPQRLETLVLGDTVGTGGGWSRPARYGGIRWGRDFSMRPGFVTMPQLSFSGQAALPSTVEVLINNTRRMSEPVQPGPFELTNVPMVTGTGEVNLVVRDLLGRETVIQQSYYASPRLLAPGLNDFSLEAGRLRSGYGQSSHYGDGFGNVTWRQGLSNSLTGEARLELQAHRRAAGMEIAGLLGDWAVGRMALAASSGNTLGTREHGQTVQLGIERTTPHGGGTLQYEYASQGFSPFAEGTGFEVAGQRARARMLASIGGTLWGSFSGGLSHLYQSSWNGEQVKLLGFSAGISFWRRASLNLSLNKRLDSDKSWRMNIIFSMPLGNGVDSFSRINRANDGFISGDVSATYNAPAGPGFGWRVQGSTESSQRASANVQYNTSQAELAADAVSSATGQVAMRGGVRGTLGLLASLPFASRPVGQGSFAVVDTGGLSAIPIRRSNRIVAETDSRGLAFVPGLLPWQKNQIEIDPVDLPLDVEIGETLQHVTPYAGSGLVVKFAMRRMRQALVQLQQSDGKPVPIGARVRLLPDGTPFIVGHRGEVWLSGPNIEREHLQVSWGSDSCELEVMLPVSDGMPKKIGPLICVKNSP